MKEHSPFEEEENTKEELKRVILQGSLRGAQPLFRENLPLPLDKGKGIKGIGLPSKSLRG